MNSNTFENNTLYKINGVWRKLGCVMQLHMNGNYVDHVSKNTNLPQNYFGLIFAASSMYYMYSLREAAKY